MNCRPLHDCKTHFLSTYRWNRNQQCSTNKHRSKVETPETHVRDDLSHTRNRQVQAEQAPTGTVHPRTHAPKVPYRVTIQGTITTLISRSLDWGSPKLYITDSPESRINKQRPSIRERVIPRINNV